MNIDITDLESIKKAARDGQTHIWVNDGDKEGLILARKYSLAHLEKMTLRDILRITVW